MPVVMPASVASPRGGFHKNSWSDSGDWFKQGCCHTPIGKLCGEVYVGASVCIGDSATFCLPCGGINSRIGAALCGWSCMTTSVDGGARTCKDADREARSGAAVCEEPFNLPPKCAPEKFPLVLPDFTYFTIRCACVGRWRVLPYGKDFDPHTGSVVDVADNNNACARQPIRRCRRMNDAKSGCRCLCWMDGLTADPRNRHGECFRCDLFGESETWNWDAPGYFEWDKVKK